MVVHPLSGAIGLVLNLEIDSVGIVMLSDTKNLRSGDSIVRMFDTLSINVDPLMLGNVFDVTGKLLNISGTFSGRDLTY
jgi:F-type H+-transporting ATPase subunit alpha